MQSLEVKNDWGLILLDYVDGTNLEELDLSNFSQVEKYELCLKILKAIEGHIITTFCIVISSRPILCIILKRVK